MLYLDPYQEKVDLADNDIFEVVSEKENLSFQGVRRVDKRTHFDLLYSNSICKQSSIPTSILIELLLSGGMRKECTHMSFSLTTSCIRRDIETRTKYLNLMSMVERADRKRTEASR